MAAHGEFFLVTICQCYLPNKNDNQSEKINVHVSDESQAENRPMPEQEAEIR